MLMATSYVLGAGPWYLTPLFVQQLFSNSLVFFMFTCSTKKWMPIAHALPASVPRFITTRNFTTLHITPSQKTTKPICQATRNQHSDPHVPVSKSTALSTKPASAAPSDSTNTKAEAIIASASSSSAATSHPSSGSATRRKTLLAKQLKWPREQESMPTKPRLLKRSCSLMLGTSWTTIVDATIALTVVTETIASVGSLGSF